MSMPGFIAEKSLHNCSRQYVHLYIQMDRTDSKTVIPAWVPGASFCVKIPSRYGYGYIERCYFCDEYGCHSGREYMQ
jgi:hypothetical protein